MHRQRVAYLCGVIAKELSIEELAAFALELAARFHNDKYLLLTHQSEETPDSPITSLVGNMAEAILRPRWRASLPKPDRNLELCGQIFEACDELDHSVEIAEYEQSSIRSAMEEFLRSAPDRFEPAICDALQRLVTPRAEISLTGNLPVLPAAAMRLMRVSSDDTTVIELEGIAETDPVLAARVMGAANSVMFGYHAEPRSLREAVARLGIPLARTVLMNAVLGRLFASSALQELWNHSKLAGAAAHALATECGYEAETAYVAGLLHDVGRIVLQRGPAHARAEEADLLANGFPLTYAETLLYGTDHATLGAALLSQWNVDAAIVEAVAHHHRPGSDDSRLAAILCLAEDETATSVQENLSQRMHRAIAMELTGMERLDHSSIQRDSPIFALVG